MVKVRDVGMRVHDGIVAVPVAVPLQGRGGMLVVMVLVVVAVFVFVLCAGVAMGMFVRGAQ